jgi:glycosyltransferase involved in cell wall biosynthesis
MANSVVDIIMVTYNHEKYIAQAIGSVLMQKTTFPYHLIIGEDCSTDKTPAICHEYEFNQPDKITIIEHKINQGLLRNYKSVLDRCTAKYLAILEGDDYWNDENKLQKQYDYLESNHDVGLVHTNCDLVFESGKIQLGSHKRYKNCIKNGLVFDQLLTSNYIRTATVMMRKDLYDKYISIEEYIQKGFKTFDYPAWLDIALYKEFHYLDYSSATYRIHKYSLSHSNEYPRNKAFMESTAAIKKYAIEKNNCDSQINESLKNKYLADQITFEMSFRNYNEVSILRKNLKTTNIKTFILNLLTINKHLINAYYFINKKRQEMIKNDWFLIA